METRGQNGPWDSQEPDTEQSHDLAALPKSTNLGDVTDQDDDVPALSSGSDSDSEETWNGFSTDEEAESEEMDVDHPVEVFIYTPIAKQCIVGKHLHAMLSSANLSHKGRHPWMRGVIHSMPFNFPRGPTTDIIDIRNIRNKMRNKRHVARAIAIYLAGSFRLGKDRCKRCEEIQVPIRGVTSSAAAKAGKDDWRRATVNDSSIPFCVSAFPFCHGVCASCELEGRTLQERLKRCSLSKELTAEGYDSLSKTAGQAKIGDTKSKLDSTVGVPLFVGTDNNQRALIKKLLEITIELVPIKATEQE
ncbi:hypothetical protein QBC43DRAFT_355250 [Cladorrhinum sp. PSN259]|nr:hypothetical protein QBC43DRAFT_355250 [Cladorrhinum sp. PSN259]